MTGGWLQPPIRATAANRLVSQGPGSTRLDLVEDLPPLALELALADGAALAQLLELPDVRHQVDQRRREPAGQIGVRLAVELGRPRVPGLEVEEGLERRVGQGQGLDSIALGGHQPQGHPMDRMAQLAVEVALEHLAVLEPDGD